MPSQTEGSAAMPKAGEGKESSASHVCPLCDSSFRRLEHLSRHILSHTGSKSHSCHVCHKSFNRKDTLLRHLPIHEDSDRISSKPANVRVSRACSQCAKSRLRCDGQSPCTRCQSKGWNCAYSGRSRKRIPTLEELRQQSEPMEFEGETREGGNDYYADHQYSARRLSQQSISPSLSSPNAHAAAPDLLQANSAEIMTMFAPEPLERDNQQQPAPLAHAMSAQNPTLHGSVPDVVGVNPTMQPFWNYNWAGDIEISVMDWITTDNSFLGLGSSTMAPRDTSHAFPYTNDSNITNDANGYPYNLAQTYRPQVGVVPAAEPVQVNHGNPMHLGSLLQEDPAAASRLKPDLERQWPTNWDPTRSDNVVPFPDMSHFPVDVLEAESFGHVESLSPQVYHEICQSLKRNGSSHFRSFHNANLPSIEAFDCFLQLYFEYFHPIFPFLHKPSFDPRNAPWQLVLAIATIGFRYSKVSFAAKGSNAIQELLRRSLASTIEGDNSTARELWFTQALLLGSVGMTYSGNRRLLEIAESGRNACITQCRRKGVFRMGHHQVFNLDSMPESQPCKDEWQSWVDEESRRRIGLCTFIIDFQNELYFDGTPCLSLMELESKLPCSEDLWAASSSGQWRRLYKQQDVANHVHSVTVHQALAQLRTRELPSNISEFGHLILTYAVYRTVRSIRNLSGNPFLSDMLSKQSFINDTSTKALSLLQAWYPTPPNSKTMLSFSVICHKYCVSMLLCCPRQALLNYVHRSNTVQHEKSKEVISSWIKNQEGSMARRAVSYAGLLLGKLSELKFHAPYTPIMIALSTITIWTYSHVIEMASSGAHINGGAKSMERGSVVRLEDGELDEEREAWIQGTEGFRAHLKDVGNICRRGASSRIVDAGLQLLRSLGGWGLSQGLEQWLTTLRDQDWCQQAELRNI